MFRSSMRSSSGISLFTSLSMLLILKIIKIFKKYYQSIVVMWQHMFSMLVMRSVWRRELTCYKLHSRKERQLNIKSRAHLTINSFRLFNRKISTTQNETTPQPLPSKSFPIHYSLRPQNSPLYRPSY